MRTMAAVALADADGVRAGAADTPGARTRNVAIVLYEGVEILDFAGPSEVFAAAAGRGARGPAGVPRVHRRGDEGPVTSQGFLRVTPEFSIDDAPKPDILVIPGGDSAHSPATRGSWSGRARPCRRPRSR